MIIYKQEELDGLSDKINNNAIAYICPPKKLDINHNINIENIKSKAGVKSDKFGLFTLDSVLASVGWNANDDVFTKEHTWNARLTAIDKPVNFMHDEKDIIGHMTSAIVIDQDSKIISQDSNVMDIPDLFDIVVSAVLYTVWSDDNLESRINKIIQEIPENKWFVSMECIFNDFDYAVVTPEGEQKTIARNNETSFLTKYLRVYGGVGEYQGYKIGRQLKNFVFVGKGIVDNPANKRSVILDTQQFISKASLDTFPKVNKMDEKKLEEFQNALAGISDKIASVLEKEVKDVNDKLTAKTKECEDLQSQLDEANKALAKKDEEINSVNDKLINSERLAKATSKGLKIEEAQKLVEVWSSASNEQFDSVLGLHKPVEEKATANKVIESIQPIVEPALAVNNNKIDETRAKACEWLQSSIFQKKGKK